MVFFAFDFDGNEDLRISHAPMLRYFGFLSATSSVEAMHIERSGNGIGLRSPDSSHDV